MKGKAILLGMLIFGIITLLSVQAVSARPGNNQRLLIFQGKTPLFLQPEIDRNNLSIGEIVAYGIRQPNGDCSYVDFGSISIKTVAPSDGKTKWLAILLNQDCVAVVNAMWDGDLEMGPSAIVEPLIELLKEQSIPIPEETNLKSIGSSDIKSSTMTPSSTKTSEQLVYMYGYGGTADKLTKKTGKLTFTYNGSSATITSQSGTCQGSKILTWQWVVDGCFNTDIEYGPAEIVFREGRGDYHCKPQDSFPCDTSEPNGYYHKLFDNEDGHKDGVSHCVFWYNGTIVSGVKHQILQGCR